MITTKMWSDNWFIDLDPIEKLIFVYILTNEKTNILGLYELPLRIMSIETGIEKEMIEKVLNRFKEDKKVMYFDGWIFIKNFPRHQSVNPSIIKGIKRVLSETPDRIKRKIDRLGTDWVQSATYLNLNLNLNLKKDFEKSKSLSLNSIKNIMNEDVQIIDIDEDGNPITGKSSRKPLNKSAFYLQKVFIEKCKKEIGQTPIYNKVGYIMLCKLLKKEFTVEQLEEAITDWFDEPKKDEDLIQITQALSSNRLNRWKINK